MHVKEDDLTGNSRLNAILNQGEESIINVTLQKCLLKNRMTKRARFTFPIKDPNSAKYSTAVFMLNICFDLDLREKECLSIHLFTTSAKREKISHDKFYKTQAECCHNLVNTLGQLDLAEMLFGELIKIVFSEEGKVVFWKKQ